MSILPKIVKKSKKSSFSKSDNSAGVGRKYDFWPEIHRIRLVKHSWTIIHTSDIILHHFDFESKKFFFRVKKCRFSKQKKIWPIHLFVNLWCHILTLMWVYTYILGFFTPLIQVHILPPSLISMVILAPVVIFETHFFHVFPR